MQATLVIVPRKLNQAAKPKRLITTLERIAKNMIDKKPTRKDFEEIAMKDPAVYACYQMYMTAQLTEEEMYIAAIMILHKSAEANRELLVQYVATQGLPQFISNKT